MKCAWKELLGILPQWMRNDVDKLGRESLQELRLRINSPPELCLETGHQWLCERICADDLNFVINTASRYSPWAAVTISKGYLTAPGGHRIGICGTAVIKQEIITGIRDISSLCIRIARDFTEIGDNVAHVSGSVLILGAPGWGKTTLLRDLIRKRSEKECICVIDERGELFPSGFQRGKQMDVFNGVPKPIGIDMVLRTMGPSAIAVDEITAEADCMALLHAANCGVHLLATAHASSYEDFLKRRIYSPLTNCHVFDYLIVLHPDRSYHIERMRICK